MRKMLFRWFMADAEWWEFWKPASGAAGGAIFGAMVLIGLIAFRAGLQA